MKKQQSKKLVGTLCALAAALVLPSLAYAGKDNDHGNGGKDNDNQWGKDKGDPGVAAAPEVNPAIVLIPFIGAVLVLSARKLLRRKEASL